MIDEEVIYRQYIDPPSVVMKHLFLKIRTLVGEFVEDFITVDMGGLKMREVKPISIADGIGLVCHSMLFWVVIFIRR
jgi:hypothetical protein